MKKIVVNSIFFIFDIAFIILFYYFVANLRADIEYLPEFEIASVKNYMLFFAVIMLSLSYEKIYTLRFDFWEETKRVVKALFFSFMIIMVVLVLGKVNQEYSRVFIVSYFAGLMIFLPIYKRVYKRVLFKLSFLKKRVKIVGNISQKEMLEREFVKNWYLGFKVVDRKPDIIYIASKDIKHKRLLGYLKRYSKKIKDIYIVPYLNEINFSQSHIVELFNIRTSLVKIENNLLKWENTLIKELFEKSLVVIILPFFSVLHSVLYLLIKKDSKGKPFFIQERLGKNGKTFKCYKYRTMYENGNEILQEYLKNNPDEVEYYKIYHKYKNDPRITKIGKFLRKSSLDELPQLINVLKGEMSLIGPRPYMSSEIRDLGNDLDMILRVKPGISGLWQVSGRNELSFEDRKLLDIWYIQNWSLWMDIVILFKTLKVVLLKTGAK